jgi:hypothetical protein
MPDQLLPLLFVPALLFHSVTHSCSVPSFAVRHLDQTIEYIIQYLRFPVALLTGRHVSFALSRQSSSTLNRQQAVEKPVCQVQGHACRYPRPVRRRQLPDCIALLSGIAGSRGRDSHGDETSVRRVPELLRLAGRSPGRVVVFTCYSRHVPPFARSCASIEHNSDSRNNRQESGSTCTLSRFRY